MDASLPVAILFAALALMLGFVPRRIAVSGVVIAGVVALTIGQLPLPPGWATPAITSCWVGVIGLTCWIYWPDRLSTVIAITLAAATGVLAGLTIGSAVASYSAYPALAAMFLVIPSSLAVQYGYAIVPRVVSSWLIAVSVLAAFLPYLVSHPGYVPEHRE